MKETYKVERDVVYYAYLSDNDFDYEWNSLLDVKDVLRTPKYMDN